MYGVPQGSVLGPILFVLCTTPLSDIIANHSVNHHLFADAAELQNSAPLSEVTNLTKELNACTDDIKTWMTENQLKLNDDKTEALLFTFSSSLSRKFRTLLQDLFYWHPVTTTQHLSWDNCTGFPFQNVLSIESLVCVSVL